MPDFADIPGMTELWTHTQGDPRITIAVLDSAADLEPSCFKGANLTKVQPFWHEEIEIDPQTIDTYREIQNSGESSDIRKEKLAAAIPDEKLIGTIGGIFHATHVCSNIFGQPGSTVEGIAPNCRGINIPISADMDTFISPLNLARAINLALELGANIIHCAACRPTQTGVAHELLEKAVRQAQENNILIVAPTGNNKGECWCIPAILPDVLAVGALKDTGEPFKFSNWGGQYQKQGIIAPGENILGAQPGTEETVRQKGTSCAAPVITAISSLLMSWQLQQGAAPDAEAVRAALTNSAIPCDPGEIEEPERCLLGKLNLPGAFELLTGNKLAAPDGEVKSHLRQQRRAASAGAKPSLKSSATAATESKVKSSYPVRGYSLSEPIDVQTSSPITTDPVSQEPESHLPASSPDSLTPTSITPSAGSNLVYVLGTLGYDFGTEARRDSFKQLMPAVNTDGTQIPANPYDARQMVDYLDGNLFEAKSLIWTLNLELTPIYALQPVSAFADDTYATLLQMLYGEVQAEDSEDYIERVSIAGRLTSKTVKLFSGQVIPVLKLYSPRGMYAWTVNTLVDNALAAVSVEYEDAQEQAMRKSLSSFLHRVYYDLRNVGQADRDRALNFAATNAFQAVSCFSEAVAIGMELHSIEVDKSPFCRYDSNCWDVKLKFFDPDNTRRAKKVFRFTIDVVDLVPVTLGKVRSWSVPK